MPQVSRPLLIALIAVVGFAAAWMLVLRKHATGDSGASATPPAHSAPAQTSKAPGVPGLGHAIDRAPGAVAASADSAASPTGAAAQASGEQTPAAAAPAPAAAAPPAAGPPAPAVVKAKPALRNV